MRYFSLSIIFFLAQVISAQQDTTKYPWPLSPVDIQKNISGNFGEYRYESGSAHYHNGTDIPAPAGTAVFAVLGGVVAAAYNDGSTGYDSYIRVTSQVNGKSKNITYYHTNPVVSVGQTVSAGQQVSTIAIDHVHLIEYQLGGSLTNGHINAIRPEGGLLNYNDPWKPYIRYVKFHVDNSTTILPWNYLGGKVDIDAHIEETNGTSASAMNNGTYKAGYKILSADMKNVVYDPPDNGLRYEYYNIPGNGYVNLNFNPNESSTSKHVYILTNGSGASNVMSTQTVVNNYWDTDLLPYGNYVVMVYTIDSRGNADTIYTPVTTYRYDLIPPSAPRIKYVKREGSSDIRIAWTIPSDADLFGYRILSSKDGVAYSVLRNEISLQKTVNSTTISYSGTEALYLKICAVDTVNPANVSDPSDTYGIKLSGDSSQILIVDGFDRYGGSGSWTKAYHDFARLFGETVNQSFETCANDEVINGEINLNNYMTVMWISGDESTTDEVFNTTERTKIAAYLQGGGKLFASGSEIAWDLEGSSSATQAETVFLRNYLRAKYTGDDSNIMNVYTQSPFPQFSFSYGTISSGAPYTEDYPDVIDTINGSSSVLRYSSSASAGTAYTGAFGTSAKTGQVIYFGFPFETIHTKASRIQVMNAVMEYFGIMPLDAEDNPEIRTDFSLGQNYPNPFNPTTSIHYVISEPAHVSIRVYDMLGREVSVLVNEYKTPGSYHFDYYAGNFASGVYIYRMDAGDHHFSRKLVLLK